MMTCRKHMPLIPLILILTGCYPGISGKVVEADTGKPIVGAVVVAKWSSTHGLPGLSYRETYKIIETQTDANGVFFLSGVYNPLVNPPNMIIFKEGYVPWSNSGTFEKMETYDKKIWRDGYTYRLNRWQSNYSERNLRIFLGSITGANSKDTPMYNKILRDHNY